MLTSAVARLSSFSSSTPCSLRVLQTLSNTLSGRHSQCGPQRGFHSNSSLTATSSTINSSGSTSLSSSSLFSSAASSSSSSLLSYPFSSFPCGFVIRSFATAKSKPKAAKKTKAGGKTTQTKTGKIGRPKATKKKVAIAKKRVLTPEQKTAKKERVARKQLALKHHEDRLKAQFIRSIQPAGRRAPPPLFQYIAENITQHRSGKTISPRDAVKELATKFKALSEEVKQKYVKKTAASKEKLKEEWAKYNAKYEYPKVPLSSFISYSIGRRDELMVANPSLTGKEKIAKLSKQVGEEWAKMSEEEKKNNKFFNQSKYEVDMKEYQEKKQKIDDKLHAQFEQWKEARHAQHQANRVKKEAAIPSS